MKVYVVSVTDGWVINAWWSDSIWETKQLAEDKVSMLKLKSYPTSMGYEHRIEEWEVKNLTHLTGH